MFTKATLLSLLAVNGVVGLVARSPQQDLPIDEFLDAGAVVSSAPIMETVSIPVAPLSEVLQSVKEDVQSDPVTPNTISKLRRRDSVCPALSYQTNNPPLAVYDGNENDAFYADPTFKSMADAGGANPPYPYTTSFTNQKGSYSGAGFMQATELSSYDVKACAQRCTSTKGCLAFNIFLERDPTVNHDQGANPDPCPTGAATVVKCGLWSAPFVPQSDSTFQDSHLNRGQYRGAFHVIIAASDGFSSLEVPNVGDTYTGTKLGGAIQGQYYLGVKAYGIDPSGGDKTVPMFSTEVCRMACDTQTTYNKAHGGEECRYFNAYLLSQTDLNGGGSGGSTLTCSLYSRAPSYYLPLGKSENDIATNYGQTRGSKKYTVSSSFGYTRKQA